MTRKASPQTPIYHRVSHLAPPLITTQNSFSPWGHTLSPCIFFAWNVSTAWNNHTHLSSSSLSLSTWGILFSSHIHSWASFSLICDSHRPTWVPPCTHRSGIVISPSSFHTILQLSACLSVAIFHPGAKEANGPQGPGPHGCQGQSNKSETALVSGVNGAQWKKEEKWGPRKDFFNIMKGFHRVIHCVHMRLNMGLKQNVFQLGIRNDGFTAKLIKDWTRIAKKLNGVRFSSRLSLKWEQVDAYLLVSCELYIGPITYILIHLDQF